MRDDIRPLNSLAAVVLGVLGTLAVGCYYLLRRVSGRRLPVKARARG